MIVLFGPCMFLAPLLVVLIPVAIVLWPPVLAILGALWLIVWPFAAIGSKIGATGVVRAHAALGRWFVVLLRPWRYFDVPVRAAAPPPVEPPVPPVPPVPPDAGTPSGGPKP